MIRFLHLFALLVWGCNTNTQINLNQSEFATTFVSDFASYRMDIQAAGIATIPASTLAKDKTLTIAYAYFSEGEERKGKMVLVFNEISKLFEGNWKTNTDNGNVYHGSLYFNFKENGEASGKYAFMGSEYKITIFIP